MSFRSAVAQDAGIDGLADLSADWRGVRIQGANAASWLGEQGVLCPETLFALDRQGSNGDAILIARVGSRDVVVHGAATSASLRALESALSETNDVFQVPEQAATFRLSGSRAESALHQTCAVPLHTEPIDTVIYTRVAGVSCAIIPENTSTGRSYRIWVDYSHAKALWQSLAEILAD